MKKDDYKKLIEGRVNSINEIFDTNYQADYTAHYGGWNLFIVGENGGHSRGYIGFDYRKSNTEMLNYLDGILAGIHFWRMTK